MEKIYRHFYDNDKNNAGEQKPNELLGEFEIVEGGIDGYDFEAVGIRKEDGKSYTRLTKSGEEKLVRYELGEMAVEKPKHWDGKWRLVIFDIRERRRTTRDLLRQQLQGLGLVRLQNSVWVYPYDFSELTVLFKADAMIGKDILYLTVEELENDSWLRKHFGL